MRVRVKYYQSETMGNLVRTKREVIAQVLESLFKFRVLDIHWRVVEQIESK